MHSSRGMFCLATTPNPGSPHVLSRGDCPKHGFYLFVANAQRFQNTTAYWTSDIKRSLQELANQLNKRQFERTVYCRPKAVSNNTEAYTLTPYHELKLAKDLE